MKINFTLNGTRRSVLAEPGENLQVLLQRMGIPSVRSSDDGEGFAGSDTILFDGKAVLAGLMVAGQAEGHAVETIESLSRDSRLVRAPGIHDRRRGGPIRVQHAGRGAAPGGAASPH